VQASADVVADRDGHHIGYRSESARAESEEVPELTPSGSL
jgi:hypothetical protein